MRYLSDNDICGKRHDREPRYGQTRTGYGNKIPTSVELLLSDNRWHRVYVVIWSNMGTRYVVFKGNKHYLQTGCGY